MIGHRTLQAQAAPHAPAIGRQRRLPLDVAVRPRIWLSAAPVAVATALISLAALLYMVQANQVSVLEFSLVQAQQQRAQLADVNTELHVRLDRLDSMQRIETVATGQLHMSKPAASSVIWVRPIVSGTAPTVPPQVHVETGPLPWMKRALHVLWSLL